MIGRLNQTKDKTLNLHHWEKHTSQAYQHLLVWKIHVIVEYSLNIEPGCLYEIYCLYDGILPW